MSQSLWCDKGDHAFSSKDEDKQHFSQTQTVKFPTGNSYGRTTYEDRREVTEELDICGPCWKTGSPFSKDKAAITGYSSETEKAEAEAELSESEMWRAKYEAEKARNSRVDYRDNHLD